MNKKDLIPLKHVLVTRKGQVYWYVGNSLGTMVQYGHTITYLCMSTATDISDDDEFLLDNLLANRNGYWDKVLKQPRDYDIIYVFEITDSYRWIKYIRDHTYIENVLHGINKYYNEKVVKLLWERIDGVFEGKEKDKWNMILE